jgi:hypothetical protein
MSRCVRTAFGCDGPVVVHTSCNFRLCWVSVLIMAPSTVAPPPLSTDGGSTTCTSTRGGRKGFRLPTGIYQSVSEHIVSLITCRAQESKQRRRSSSLTQKKPVRGGSDASSTTASSSYSSSWSANDQYGHTDVVLWPNMPSAYLGGRDDGRCRGMRAEQSVCLNCRALYFVGMVADGLFCSLDCRTSFLFTARKQRRMEDTTMGSSPPMTLTVGDFGQDSDDDDDECGHDSSLFSPKDLVWVAIQEDPKEACANECTGGI